jgi:GDPmannose 4,6-dehydratase
MKKVLITGADGQDGAYLAEYLVKKKNYKVFCSVRSLKSNLNNLNYLGIQNKIFLLEGNLLEKGCIDRLFDQIGKIDEIYNFAAISYVPSSFTSPNLTFETNTLPVLNFLEKIKNSKNKIKFYQASTSEMYGNAVSNSKKNEKSEMIPVSPYGISKLSSHNLCKVYRDSYNVHSCSGILFNHESPLRGQNFVTKKVVTSLAKYVLGQKRDDKLGNVFAKRDWGYAKDYVEGIYKIMQQSKADDYVLATGKSYSVKDFVTKCLKSLNIKHIWVIKNKKYQCVDKKNNKVIFYTESDQNIRPNELHVLIGDGSKAKKNLQWQPKTSIDNLIKIMLNAEFEFLS